MTSFDPVECFPNRPAADDTTEVMTGFDPAVPDATPVALARDDHGRFTVPVTPGPWRRGGIVDSAAWREFVTGRPAAPPPPVTLRDTIAAQFAGRRYTYDPAFDRATLRLQERRLRLADEVDRHLAEVAHEWRQARRPDAAQAELARGIGTAFVIVGAALIVAVVVIALGLAS